MKEQMDLLKQRRRWLSELRKFNFKNYTDEDLSYTYQSPLLIKCWPFWKLLHLIIDLYFINECCLWIAFYSFYQLSFSTFLPLSIILLLLLLTNIVFHIFMTPRLPSPLTLGLSQKSQVLLQIQHYMSYKVNGWEIVINLLFIISYLLPYQPAKYIHLVYTFKIAVMRASTAEFYSAIHTYKFLRIIYHLVVLFYIMIYLSHVLGIIFYVIDQQLINSQYFGDPLQNPNVYYQTSSQAFTPIEMLSQFQKYIMAFYFANGLVTTIAYGDIVGKNFIQDVYVGILMVVSTIQVAFLLEQFMIMLRDNSFEVFEIIKKFRHLRLAMSLKNVSNELQLKIRNYIFYIEYYDKFKNPEQIVQKLSNKMQLDLYYQGYGHCLAPILKPLGVQNIRAVCKYLKEVSYQPQIDIFTPLPKQKPNQLANQHSVDILIARPNFTYILQGKALQYFCWNPSSKQFKIRQGIKSINLFQFFTQTRVRFGLRSKTVLKAVTLARDDLSLLLSENPQSHKQIKQQKEQLLSCCITRSRFQDDCQICNQNDHTILDCPQVFLVINQHIRQADKIDQILSKTTNKRKNKLRKQLKSHKQHKTMHYSVVLEQLDFLSLFSGQNQQQQKNQDLGTSLIQKMLKNICQKTMAVDLPEQDISADSSYDQQGLDPLWNLQ